MPVCCEVALPVPLDRVFTYAVPSGRSPQRGARVIVPFRSEKLIGVVTAVDVLAPADVEVRFLEAVLDDEPLLSEQLLTLAEWMAQYYLAPLGEVLRGMLPLTAEVRRTVYYRITDLGRDTLADSLEHNSAALSERLGRKQRGKLSPEEHDMEHRVLERLACGEPVKVSILRTATAATLPVLAALVRKKWIARETAAAERDARRTERFAVLIPEARLPSLTAKQQAIMAELAACGGELPLAELRSRDLPSSTLQTLVRRGLVRIDERPAAFRLGGLVPAAEPFRLNEPQTEALASIAACMESRAQARQPSTSPPCSAPSIAASHLFCLSRRSVSPRKLQACSTRPSDSAWPCFTPRSRRKSAASSGGASAVAMRLSWSVRARPSLLRRRVWVSSSSTRNMTRATSRRRLRAITPAMWP